MASCQSGQMAGLVGALGTADHLQCVAAGAAKLLHQAAQPSPRQPIFQRVGQHRCALFRPDPGQHLGQLRPHQRDVGRTAPSQIAVKGLLLRGHHPALHQGPGEVGPGQLGPGRMPAGGLQPIPSPRRASRRASSRPRHSRRRRWWAPPRRTVGWSGDSPRPSTCSSWPRHWQDHSTPLSTRGPTAGASRSRRNPARVSWSVSASRSTPCSPARRRRASGLSSPSEARLWVWRSTFNALLLFGLDPLRPRRPPIGLEPTGQRQYINQRPTVDTGTYGTGMDHADADLPQRPRHNLLANLGFNIILPTLVLIQLSQDDRLGPVWALVVALAFPLCFGLRDLVKIRRANLFSVLGVVSVLLTGGMGLLRLDPEYIAIKEAAVPALLGLATLLSLRSRYPLVRTFLYNDQVLQVQRVDAALRARHNERAFERRLTVASWLVAGSFFLSAVLNYVLARMILVSPPGSSEFTAELGKMTALSFPVIALPSMVVLMGALFYLLRGIQTLTDLALDDIFHEA